MSLYPRSAGTRTVRATLAYSPGTCFPLDSRADLDIRGDAAELLAASTEIQATDIAVTVSAGVLALNGYVRRFRDKYRAEDLVKCLAGVIAVANDIEVLPGGRISDPELARAAVACLQLAVPADAAQLKPIVRRRVVTLEGSVAHACDRALAVAAVRSLPGVESIVDLISVRS